MRRLPSQDPIRIAEARSIAQSEVHPAGVGCRISFSKLGRKA